MKYISARIASVITLIVLAGALAVGYRVFVAKAPGERVGIAEMTISEPLHTPQKNPAGSDNQAQTQDVRNLSLRTPGVQVHPSPTVHPLRLADGARKYALENIKSGPLQDRILARRILQECAMGRRVMKVHEMGIPPATSDPKVAAVFNDTLNFFQRRCGQFTELELDELLDIDFKSSSPLISMYNGKGAGLNGARETLIRELIASKSPVLFDDLALRVLVDTEGSRKFVYFRGVVNRLDDGVVVEALHFLPCLLGLDCSPTSFRYGLACLNAQQCEPINYTTNALANEMYADIMAGNIESFIRKR